MHVHTSSNSTCTVGTRSWTVLQVFVCGQSLFFANADLFKKTYSCSGQISAITVLHRTNSVIINTFMHIFFLKILHLQVKVTGLKVCPRLLNETYRPLQVHPRTFTLPGTFFWRFTTFAGKIIWLGLSITFCIFYTRIDLFEEEKNPCCELFYC